MNKLHNTLAAILLIISLGSCTDRDQSQRDSDDIAKSESITLVKFDTQDNIWLESFQFPNCDVWNNQENEASEPINIWSLKRIPGDTEQVFSLRFKSDIPVRSVSINKYPFKYKVEKISANEFVLSSPKFQEYVDTRTEIFELIISY